MGTIQYQPEDADVKPSRSQSMQQLYDQQRDKSSALQMDSLPTRRKSKKRKAAEALLAARYAGTSLLDGPSTSGVLSLDASRSWSSTTAEVVHIEACPKSCGAAGASNGWCHFQASVPAVRWSAVLATVPQQPQQQWDLVQPGLWRVALGHGLTALVLDQPSATAAAVAELRASMADAILGIDLEWRPDRHPGANNRVALVQIASGTTALLVRTCCMGYSMPSEVRSLLSANDIVLVGFSWANSDELKLKHTFGFGRSAMACFFDLQDVAVALGYLRCGLAALTEHVLGTRLPKAKSISTGNWEARDLSRAQVRYAAMDALVAGQVFRGLRLWHSSPSPCASCLLPLGGANPAPSRLACGACQYSNKDLRNYLQHCQDMSHQPLFRLCPACGRVTTIIANELGGANPSTIQATVAAKRKRL